MKSKNKQDEFDGKVTSWTQKIGVSLIGILTILGSGLIIYTGVMAATYEAPKSENEFLTYEDATEQTPEDLTNVDENNAPSEEATPPATDSSNEQSSTEQTDSTQNQPTQTNNNEAYCNVDGVNVRSKAATGTDIIGNLNAGDQVQVLDRYYSDEWIQVSFEGKTGYVYVDYLTFE
ncbi:MAG: SH3 domain-containing protein [Turicibacter sp.]|nr:SH3 domain-containing protein [Turicibacter sp.]